MCRHPPCSGLGVDGDLWFTLMEASIGYEDRSIVRKKNAGDSGVSSSQHRWQGDSWFVKCFGYRTSSAMKRHGFPLRRASHAPFREGKAAKQWASSSIGHTISWYVYASAAALTFCGTIERGLSSQIGQLRRQGPTMLPTISGVAKQRD
jgi:hypothetical protein